jgi:tripartite-type tricarboxylate transporter receptor subunit TctC
MKKIKTIMASLMVSLSFAASANNVEIIVPFTAGGATDTFARAAQLYLSKAIPTSNFIVVNKPGADGRIAGRYAVAKPADGTSLAIIGTGPFLYTKVLNNNLGYDYSDFDIVGPMAGSPMAVIVGASVPASNLAEFAKFAKTNPVNCGWATQNGNLAAQYIASEMKLPNINFIPYKGSSQVVADLVGGHLNCAIDVPTAYLTHHNAKTVRVIAIPAPTKLALTPMPQVISKKVLPNFSFNAWFGIGVLHATPLHAKAPLIAALREMMYDPAFISSVEKVNLDVVTPMDNLPEFIESEYLRLERLRVRLHIDKTN